MDKQKILKEIQKTKKHLANMKKMLAECEYERWKPKYQELYFSVDIENSVISFFNHEQVITDRQLKVFNCFKTRKQAEVEAEKILIRRQLEDIARRLNKGRKIDWNNTNQSKYFIGVRENCKRIIWDDEHEYKHQGVVYCLDSNFPVVAFQEIGEERLKNYLKG